MALHNSGTLFSKSQASSSTAAVVTGFSVAVVVADGLEAGGTRSVKAEAAVVVSGTAWVVSAAWVVWADDSDGVVEAYFVAEQRKEFNSMCWLNEL